MLEADKRHDMDMDTEIDDKTLQMSEILYMDTDMSVLSMAWKLLYEVFQVFFLFGTEALFK